MRIRKFRRVDNGFIFYQPVGQWYGAYEIVDGHRLGLPPNYLSKYPSDLVAEGEQTYIERGDGGAAPHVEQ